MAKRHSDALFIQQGACNPSGVARALHNACKECIAENTDQRTDPAVRLIAHQLAFLLDVGEIDKSLTLYRDLTEACEREAKGSGHMLPPEPSPTVEE